MKQVQFGLLPGKGQNEAWQKILDVKNSKFIFEFDLAKFFDTVPWKTTSDGLKATNYPNGLITWTESAIKNCGNSNPARRLEELTSLYEDLSKTNLIDLIRILVSRGWSQVLKESRSTLANHQIAERLAMIRDWIKGDKSSEEARSTMNLVLNTKRGMKYVPDFSRKAENQDPFLHGATRLVIHKICHAVKMSYSYYFGGNNKLERILGMEDMTWSPFFEEFEFPNHPQTKRCHPLKGAIAPLAIGVPQGFGASPLLATIALNPIYSKWKNHLLMYMDDGILYSDSAIDIQDFKDDLEKLGITLSERKSKYVKYNGFWVSKLKFLGLEYNPYKNELKGKTRNGSEVTCPILKFPKDYKLHQGPSYTDQWLEALNNLPFHKQLLKAGLWGYASAKMYGSPKGDITQKPMQIKRSSLWKFFELEDQMDARSASSKLARNLAKGINVSKLNARDQMLISTALKELYPSKPSGAARRAAITAMAKAEQNSY